MNKQAIEKLEDAARILRVVAHPTRMHIIRVLEEQKCSSVSALQKILKTTQSSTSQHLAALRNEGIIGYKKDANVCHYFLKNKRVIKLLNCVTQCRSKP